MDEVMRVGALLRRAEIGDGWVVVLASMPADLPSLAPEDNRLIPEDREVEGFPFELAIHVADSVYTALRMMLVARN